MSALRDCQAEEARLMDHRFRKLRRRLNTVRRESLGYDRHSRRYWLAGLEDSSAVGAVTARACILIEPFLAEESLTGKGLERGVPRGEWDGWEYVEGPGGVEALLATLCATGLREGGLRERIEVLAAELKTQERAAFGVGGPRVGVLEGRYRDYLRCKDCGKVRQVPGPGGSACVEGGEGHPLVTCADVMEGEDACRAPEQEDAARWSEAGTCEWANPYPGWERRFSIGAGGGRSVTYNPRYTQVVEGGGAGGSYALRKVDMTRHCLPALLQSEDDVVRFRAINPDCKIDPWDFDFSTVGPLYGSAWLPPPPPPVVTEEEEVKEARGKAKKGKSGGKGKGKGKGKKDAVGGGEGAEGAEGAEGGVAAGEGSAVKKKKEEERIEGGFGAVFRVRDLSALSHAVRSCRRKMETQKGRAGPTVGEMFEESLLAPCNDSGGGGEEADRGGEVEEATGEVTVKCFPPPRGSPPAAPHTQAVRSCSGPGQGVV